MIDAKKLSEATRTPEETAKKWLIKQASSLQILPPQTQRGAPGRPSFPTARQQQWQHQSIKSFYLSFYVSQLNRIRLVSKRHCTVLCKGNESVIQRNSQISRLFDEKCHSIIHLETARKFSCCPLF